VILSGTINLAISATTPEPAISIRSVQVS
jgi:hypothetical protein